MNLPMWPFVLRAVFPERPVKFLRGAACIVRIGDIRASVNRLLPKGWSKVLNEMQDRIASGKVANCYTAYIIFLYKE
jgi:hypothetical protein